MNEKPITVFKGIETKFKGDEAFRGEEMICVVCNASQKSHPDIESNWRLVEMHSGSKFYVCDQEIPEDGTGKAKMQLAWQFIIGCCLSEDEIRNKRSGDPLIESLRKLRREGKNIQYDGMLKAISAPVV